MVIIVPCYNEADRLQTHVYATFLKKNKSAVIVFSDDGSTDQTLMILQKIKREAKNQVYINELKYNKGKATAVRSGFQFANTKLSFEKIAYLDADLSTSLEECLFLSEFIDSKISFVFGSRISKIDNQIVRRYFRFFTGRIIATLISRQLGLTVYDTQCGCKIFRADLASFLFWDKFYSKWLFDVEIFHRLIHLIGKNSIKHTVREIPLKSWIDSENSKVQLTYFFRFWFDLYAISRKYKKKEKVTWKALPQNTF
ncbi:MAG: glycosyltransferase [Flavobacteriaceae bacterium]|nr:glycosyltransferase [Flavobacteriaceae bacterium]